MSIFKILSISTNLVLATTLIVIGLSNSASGHSSDILTLQSSALWRGMHDIIVENNTAYCLMDLGLQIVDISNPKQPQLVSELALLDGLPTKFAMRGDFFFVAHGKQGLTVIELSRPSQLTELVRVKLPGEAIDIKIHGEIALVLTTSCAVILDISDPLLTHSISRFSTDLPGVGIGLTGERAYLSKSSGEIEIYSLENLSEPLEIGRITLPLPIRDIAVMNDVVYLTTDATDLLMYDCAVPSAIQVIGYFDTNNGTQHIEVRDSLVFLDNGRQGLLIVNAQRPWALTLIGTFTTLGDVEAIYLNNNRLYIAGGATGLQAADISNPSSPVWAVNYFTSGETLAATLQGNKIIVSDGSAGLRGFEAQGPLSTNEFQHWDVENCNSCSARKSVASASRVYTYFREYATDHLRVFSFNESPPRLLADFQGQFFGYPAIAIGGDTLLILLPNIGLSLVDYSNLALPKLISSLGINVCPDAKLIGNIVYAAMGDYGLNIVDISDRSSPVFVGSFNSFEQQCHWEDGPGFDPWYVCTGGARSVARVGEFLFAGNEWEGLIGIDFQNPDNPFEVFSSGIGGYYSALANYEDYLFFAQDHSLGIYDVSNPIAPILIGKRVLPAPIRDMQIEGNRLLVAATSAVLVFEIDVATSITDSDDVLPGSFAISQNYPNPFNANTIIDYTVEMHSQILIEVYNILGQKVRTLVNESMMPGRYQTEWDGNDQSGDPVASGVYLYKIKSDDFAETRKMLLLK